MLPLTGAAALLSLNTVSEKVRQVFVKFNLVNYWPIFETFHRHSQENL